MSVRNRSHNVMLGLVPSIRRGASSGAIDGPGHKTEDPDARCYCKGPEKYFSLHLPISDSNCCWAFSTSACNG